MKPKNTELARAIGRRILERRLARDLTQPALAKKCGWGASRQGRVGNYERGRRIPDDASLSALARALDCSVGALIFGTTVSIHFVSVPLVEWNSIGKVKRSKIKTPLIQWPSVVPIGPHAQVTTVPPGSRMQEFADGQLILVDTSLAPRSGDYVIALIDDVQKVRRFDGEFLIADDEERRQPSNILKAMTVYSPDTTPILAVVISSVKTYR